MAKFSNPLDNVKIASPCSQDWNSMVGDDRRRFCGECSLNVYNLSGMTKTEAESLLINAEGRLCVRFYRRSDGSVITTDCPVGWARLKQRARVFATAAASLLFAFFGAVGLQSLFTKSTNVTKRLPIPLTRETPAIMGAIPVSTPTPKQSPTPERYEIMGKLVSPKTNKKTAR